uniref:Uncharacterized protein n=1 Tax=Cacopsylla melanoneura TaxID=428564 RepID=A0A8D9E798_9HEMI
MNKESKKKKFLHERYAELRAIFQYYSCLRQQVSIITSLSLLLFSPYLSVISFFTSIRPSPIPCILFLPMTTIIMAELFSVWITGSTYKNEEQKYCIQCYFVSMLF